MKEGSRLRTRTGAIALLACAALPLAAHAALAQGPRPAGAAPAKNRATARPAQKKAPVVVDAGAAAASAPPPALAAAPAVTSISSDAGLVEAKTLDGGTRVFKFSELDIEGRLKSPQLVYFLRRVRAEFAAGDLGHRSFLREMSETRKESSF
jgi:hypothetical protein